MKTVFELIEANGLTLHGDIEHFAELIRLDEREACAKVCEEVERKATMQPPMVGQGCQACAAAIRARGQA